VSKILVALLAILILAFYFERERRGNSTYFRKIRRGRRAR